MKNLIFKIIRSLPGTIAAVGFFTILCAAGASDNGAPIGVVLPLVLLGVCLFFGGALPYALRRKS